MAKRITFLLVLISFSACSETCPEPGEPVIHNDRFHPPNYPRFVDYDEEDRAYAPPAQHRLDINEEP